MKVTLFTASGCTRCKVAKRFMDERGVAYAEKDINGEGKEDFQHFYRDHRRTIYRSEEGVQFPILSDVLEIRQGLARVLAYVLAGSELDGFIGYGDRTGDWVDGLHVSGGDVSEAEAFSEVLRFLKKNGVKLELDTDGRNADLLERLLEEGMGDRVVMDVKGPLSLYAQILRVPIDDTEIRKAIRLVPRFPEYRFETTVVPLVSEEVGSPGFRHLTPDEIGKTAELIEEVTGDSRQPYVLRPFRPEHVLQERLKSLEVLPQKDLLHYRTAARRHLVYTEIEKL
ncbi:MAG: glutaredoxin domain-containing protein [Desulfobacterales bacterium]|jgi:pyruvate formate lyase activating enzyme